MAKEDLFDKDIETLREKFFGNVIKKMHDKHPIILSGTTGDIETNLAPFLYFYDSIILHICPGCPQAIEPKKLEPFLKRGLVSVSLSSDYSDYFPEFQELAFRYPEYFMGPEAMAVFKMFRVNESPPHSREDDCISCSVRNKLTPYSDQISQMGEDGEMLGGAIRSIEDNIVPVSEYAADLFIETINNLTPNSLRELTVTTNLIDYMTATNALKCTPQFNSDVLGKIDFLLKPLRINHIPELDIEQYLEIIQNYKGTLPPSLIPNKKEKVIPQVMKINEEIEKIESSKRRKLESFVTDFVPDMASILSRITTNGTYGAEGISTKALKNYSSPRLSKIRSKILSHYYNVSEVGAQIWQIRKKLDKN